MRHPRAEDLTDEDYEIIERLLETHTAQNLAEELLRRCGCAFDHRLPHDAPPVYECSYHRRLREGRD